MSGGEACRAFLKRQLPKLGYRWEGFRKVHRQVCKRIRRRLAELRIESFTAYERHLEENEEERNRLDAMTHITISRFFRDRRAWDRLEKLHLPALLAEAAGESRPFRCWSAGCASGEEPYSFAILWHETLAPSCPGLRLELIATDADEQLLARAQEACYPEGSLKEVPPEWRGRAFRRCAESPRLFRLREQYRILPAFLRQDVRERCPEGTFDLVFCKNVVAMYMERRLAARILDRIAGWIRPGGLLVLGSHEPFPLPQDGPLEPLDPLARIYRRRRPDS